jgi:hypothetical protein
VRIVRGIDLLIPIADGVLVDLSQADSVWQHWKYPFACTSAGWAIIEAALQQSG